MWVFPVLAGVLLIDVPPLVFDLPAEVTQATLGGVGVNHVNDISTNVCA